MSDTPEGVDLAHRQFGNGPRKVLAFHCTLAHSGAWRGVAQRLEDMCTFTCPDMLCHGRSPDWDGVGNFQDVSVAAVEGLFEDKMDLVGHSFGATIALRLAAAYPEKLRSLTLIEPVFFAVARADDPEALAVHDVAAQPFVDLMEEGDIEGAARLFNRSWSDAGPRWPELPEATRQAMIRGIRIVPACRSPIYDDTAGLLQPGVLDRITAPALVIGGSTTDPVIGVVNDGLARRLPNAANLVVNGAGHMVPITHPNEVAEAMVELFSKAPLDDKG